MSRRLVTQPLTTARECLETATTSSEEEVVGRLLHALLHVTPDAVTPQARGFVVSDAGVARRLTTIGAVFASAFNRALETEDVASLDAWCDLMPSELRGFALEGAAFGLVLSEAWRPARSDRWLRFLQGPAAAHIYMAHVGAGWALARIPRAVGSFLTHFDTLLRWLVVDGFGFHHGFFHTRRVLAGQRSWRVRSGYACRAFDQGVGRSLWFALGAEPERIAGAIETFELSRRADLWSGVGLAATYAGGVAAATLRRLRDAGKAYRPMLAQGAAFAAQARRRAGNGSEQTEQACLCFCDSSAERAAEVTEHALGAIITQPDQERYESWRGAVQRQFSESMRGVA